MLLFFDGDVAIMYYYNDKMQLHLCILGYDVLEADAPALMLNTLTKLRRNLKYRKHTVEILYDTGDE